MLAQLGLAQIQKSLPESASVKALYESLEDTEKHRFAKLLLFQDRWLRSPASLVDDQSFFLDPNGSSDPAAEFEAAYHAFLQAETSEFNEEKDDPRCRFPARLRFGNATLLSGGFRKLESGDCPELEQWLVVSKPYSLSLGFASMFPDGPGSMFGHTYLRIQTRPEYDEGKILNDPVLNYAAHPTSANAIVYTVAGLTGGFPGFLRFEPMYLKLQQYKNAELRDIWEYELNLTEEQVSWVPLAAWDALNHSVNYYYFDDNCALLMLHFIEVADPTRRLSDQYWQWVTPSDTVRTVADSENLVRETRFIPSQHRSFMEDLRRLPPTLRAQVGASIRSGDLESVLKREGSKHEQAIVLDTLIGYIYADEGLHTNEKSQKHEGLRKLALSKRASLGIQSTSLSIAPPDELRPDQAHRSHGLGLGAGRSVAGSPSLRLRWRPALKSIDEGGRGFVKNLAVTFMDTNLSVDLDSGGSKHARLTHLEFIGVDVLQHHQRSKFHCPGL